VILALSTSCRIASVAVLDGGSVRVEHFESRQALARTLMSRVDRLVREAGRERAAIERVAVDRGPGSFTGTRIGVSTARALASALGVPLVAATSLGLLARQSSCASDSAAGPDRFLLVAVESKSDEMFVSVRRTNGRDEAGPLLVRYADAVEFANAFGGALAVGAPWRSELIPAPLDQIELAPSGWDYPDAATLASLARDTAGGDPRAVVPLYVRVSQPEAIEGHGPRLWAPSPVRIRQATPDDLDAVLRLEKLCFLSPWPRGDIARDFSRPGSHYVMAQTADGTVVGYGVVWFVFDRGHVASVAVDPEYRRHGVGTRLMFALLDACVARGVDRMSLEYRESNTAAAVLYEKLGFEYEGVRQGYYADTGEDAIAVVLPSLDDPGIRDRHRALRAALALKAHE